MVMTGLALARKHQGDHEGAAAAASDMVSTFSRIGLKEAVLNKIRQKANDVLR
jgi:hypothetical protein